MPLLHPGDLFQRSGQDENGPAWYAAYLVAEHAGTDLPA
jgi:hypothetical protein